jgi:hypothetical protein
MSADFEKVLVKDPRLDVTDSIKYAVIKGGQNVTMSKFQAVSSSSSQLVFNVQVPSEQTIIDRRVLLRATLKVTVTTTSNGLKNANVCYGINAALASFPLHQSMDTLSATINNNTVTCNIKDVLPVILRLLEDDDLIYHNGTTPAFNDVVGLYYTSANANDFSFLSNSNTSLWGASDQKRFHRGAFPIKSYVNPGGNGNINEITYEITEPLLLSPFMFSKTKANNQGFYGIQNMNIVANLNNGARAFRGPTAGNASFLNPSGVGAAVDAGISAIAVDFWSVKPELLFTFLTPHPSDLMPARNIVPYYELPRYINGGQNACAAGVASGTGALAPTAYPLSFNAIQLNQIPDKLVLFARAKSSAANGWGIADVALPIQSISINFNNNSGILASATQQELWQMSKNNGANTTWPEFCGWGTSVNNNGEGLVVGAVPLSGSYLILEFGKDIQLTEDFYSAGSLGNFNLQCDLVASNNTTYAIAGGDVELVCITMNSGVFVCERGTSATYTGILTKQDVLEASAQEYYTHDDVKRLVGGGFFDSIKSGVSSLAKKGMKMGKEHLAKHGKSYMQQGLKMASKAGKKMLQKYTAPEDDEEE